MLIVAVANPSAQQLLQLFEQKLKYLKDLAVIVVIQNQLQLFEQKLKYLKGLAVLLIVVIQNQLRNVQTRRKQRSNKTVKYPSYQRNLSIWPLNHPL